MSTAFESKFQKKNIIGLKLTSFHIFMCNNKRFLIHFPTKLIYLSTHQSSVRMLVFFKRRNEICQIL